MLVSSDKRKGFTLIELIIGIAVFSVVMTIIVGLIAPQASRSADPIFQVRATELAQSLLNEILGKSYDEQSDRVGGRIRCDERTGDQLSDTLIAGASNCTAIASLGPDSGEGRDDFNDVDDYHGLSIFADSLGRDLDNQYQNYQLQVSIAYDGNMNGTLNETGLVELEERRAKRIQITVTLPNEESIVFSAYRSNF